MSKNCKDCSTDCSSRGKESADICEDFHTWGDVTTLEAAREAMIRQRSFVQEAQIRWQAALWLFAAVKGAVEDAGGLEAFAKSHEIDRHELEKAMNLAASGEVKP